MNSRAFATASPSIPAKTVTNFVGFLSAEETAIFRAGRALEAAQPQTELIATRTVPSFEESADSTSSGVINCSKPAEVKSSRIGATIYSGYIPIILILKD